MTVDNDSVLARGEISPAVDFVAGIISGTAALAVGFPFDTVKVRFQNPEIGVKYRSTFHALFTIVRTERVRGLFRGIASPLLTSAPLNGLVFLSYRTLMKVQLPRPDATPTLWQITLAGAGTGVIGSLITTPTELIKVRQQSVIAPTEVAKVYKPPTFYEVAGTILKTQGVRGLYRGITATALRDSGYGVYFAAYEATVRFFASPPRDSPNASKLASAKATYSWAATLVAGGMAGVTSWLATFPFDVVKTRVQSTYASAPNNPYRNTWSTITASYRAEGIGVFFRGLSPTLIRAVPVNMVTFATFEAVVRALA